ncbi:MAG: BCCT family transporter, partial [Gammaproteobacteria bacterium]|nr:BCCT family transporter [Gammaproteobacteria bacterium]
LCTVGFDADTEERAGHGVKVLWGSIIGVVSWTMVSFVGIDGIKMLSNLGGLPAAIIILASSLTLCKWLRHPASITAGK